MKNLILLILILASLHSSAQKITGFYTGSLYNDSTKMMQKYELALNEYRGSIYGYSYVTFVAKDKYYYGIRRIKAHVEGDSLIVEDDKMIINNFPEPPAKRVGRTITIPLKGQDSLVNLIGTWKTNRTKIYYSVPGSIELTKSTDSANSPLIAHLKELNLIASENIQKTATTTKNTETKVKVKENKTKIKTEVKPIPEKVEIVKLPYDKRSNKTLTVINTVSDSLVLSFYDNGVVDGDSISVYINNLPVISKVKLLSTATRKTIRVDNTDEMNLLLVAENLGTLPPNTGLLMIKDGDQTHQVNFSADMQTNAMIIIRRKK